MEALVAEETEAVTETETIIHLLQQAGEWVSPAPHGLGPDPVSACATHACRGGSTRQRWKLSRLPGAVQWRVVVRSAAGHARVSRRGGGCAHASDVRSPLACLACLVQDVRCGCEMS